MSVFVKICGLTSRADVEAVAARGPDAMGFVFWRRSRRRVAPQDVAEWSKAIPPPILKVGVFVDETAEEIERVAETAGLDVSQLHLFPWPRGGGLGIQPLEKSAADFQVTGKNGRKTSKVWKVVHLGRESAAAANPAGVDAFLVDQYSAESPGGTGLTVDWSAARAFVERSPLPVLLAGGLTPENVAEAIRQVRPWGVDVSSGVEERPGRKNLRLVQDFIERCRRS